MKKVLNPEQEEVVLHHHGPLRVSACAGAGKTTALIERVAYLVEKRKVPPKRILMISFSRAARDEMKARIDKRLPAAGAGACARTFHSIGLMIFQREVDEKREWALDTSGYMYVRAAETAYKHLALKPEKKAIVRLAELAKNNLVGSDEVLRRLGKVDPKLKECAIEAATDSQVSPLDLMQVYLKTESIRTGPGVEVRGERRRFVTYNDMIYETARLMKRKAVRERWATMWDFVLQDECQDENEAQAVIAEALASKHRNYMVVGDPAQSIYRFRGARPEKMVEFESRWPGAKTIIMHRNYRSGIEIISLANRLLDYMPANAVVTDDFGEVTPMISERKTHAFVGCHSFESSLAEAEAVAENIVEHIRDGVPRKEQAVLVRLNRMTRDIEIALATRAIPYRLISGQSFFLMKEAKALFGYLKVITNRADTDDFQACISNPSRRLGKAFVAAVSEAHDMVRKDWLTTVEKALPKLKGWQETAGRKWLDEMRGLQRAMTANPDPVSVLKKIRFSTKLDDHFQRENEDEEDNKSSENMDDLMDFASNFRSVEKMLDVVDSVEKHRSTSARKKDAVTVSTVHKAKGGEWGVVYVIQAVEGLFPHSKSDVHEERRCFYVACTRAKDELWLSYPTKGTEGRDQEVSRFIAEVDVPFELAYKKGVRITLEKVGTQMGFKL